MTGSKILGKFLALFPVRYAIERYAFRRPKGHLYDANGGLYMGRWRLIDEAITGGRISSIKDGDTIYVKSMRQAKHLRTWQSRLLERLTGYWSARLHHINRADHDRDLHNHPFDYRTFVVRGWYDEVYLNAQGAEATRRISRGQTVHSNGTFHRIAKVSPGGVWTVFVMGRNRGTWGFRVPRKPGEGVPPMGGTKGRFKFILSSDYFDYKKIKDNGMAA